MEAAFEALRAFVHGPTTSLDDASESAARSLVLAALDAALDEPSGEFSDFAQMGSMLLVRHHGLPERSWVAIADALARMLPRPEASVAQRRP